jgi:hypothetical protein
MTATVKSNKKKSGKGRVLKLDVELLSLMVWQLSMLVLILFVLVRG